jgi:hypothetical protein
VSVLFQRRCTLILAPPLPGTLQAPDASQGTLIEDLRVQFKVTKTITKEPNTAEIQVFNLAESTRSRLQARGTRVILLAGYDKDMPKLPQVFSGDSRTIDHVRQGADWITKIQCGDGERNYRFAMVNESFKPGTPITEALKKAVTAMALDPGNVPQKFGNIVSEYVSGYAMQGKASAELDSILSGQGLEWSIQDGRLQVLAPGETTTESAILVNAQSGMLDSPEHGSPEVIGKASVLKVKMLLQALAKPGRQMNVKSLNVNGFFRMEKISHSGDTFGGDWFTNIEGRAL